MLKQIKGLHHITSLAQDARRNNDFFTRLLGLRRIKKTVNFDRPDLYHLYYGDDIGTPGNVMTYFPNPESSPGMRGTGEVGATAFSVPRGSLKFWQSRLAKNAGNLNASKRFGEARLEFQGPDGDQFSLVESESQERPFRSNGDIDPDLALRGFHSATLRVKDAGAIEELLRTMNYEKIDQSANLTRFAVNEGNGANLIDIEELRSTDKARQGAGSVHHIAFAVKNRAAQLEVRKALMDTGYQVTPVIDRNYFWAIYFRTPEGILFEISTNEPGFAHDEDTAHLGDALKLPKQHEHLRQQLERTLPELDAQI